MKNILILSLLITVLIVSSCSSANVSDQELQAGLGNLSDEDLDTIIAEANKSEAPLAGQAVLSRIIPPGIKARVSNDQLLINTQAVKIKRLEKKLTDVTAKQGTPPDDNIPPGIKEVEGVPPIS